METRSKTRCSTPLIDDPKYDEDGTKIIYGEASVGIEFRPQGRVVKQEPKRHLEALLYLTDSFNADVITVQEVENIIALKKFNARLDAPYQYGVLGVKTKQVLTMIHVYVHLDLNA